MLSVELLLLFCYLLNCYSVICVIVIICAVMCVMLLLLIVYLLNCSCLFSHLFNHDVFGCCCFVCFLFLCSTDVFVVCWTEWFRLVGNLLLFVVFLDVCIECFCCCCETEVSLQRRLSCIRVWLFVYCCFLSLFRCFVCLKCFHSVAESCCCLLFVIVLWKLKAFF